MFGTNGSFDLSKLATHEDQELVNELSTPLTWAVDFALHVEQ